MSDLFFQNSLGIISAKDGTKPVAIVDIIVIGVGTGVIAGYSSIIVVVQL